MVTSRITPSQQIVVRENHREDHVPRVGPQNVRPAPVIAASVAPGPVYSTREQKNYFIACSTARSLAVAVAASLVQAGFQYGTLQLSSNLLLVNWTGSMGKTLVEAGLGTTIKEIGPQLKLPENLTRAEANRVTLLKVLSGTLEAAMVLAGAFAQAYGGNILASNNFLEASAPMIALILKSAFVIQLAIVATGNAFELGGKILRDILESFQKSTYSQKPWKEQGVALCQHFNVRHMPDEAVATVASLSARTMASVPTTVLVPLSLKSVVKGSQYQFSNPANRTGDVIWKAFQPEAISLLANAIKNWRDGPGARIEAALAEEYRPPPRQVNESELFTLRPDLRLPSRIVELPDDFDENASIDVPPRGHTALHAEDSSAHDFDAMMLREPTLPVLPEEVLRPSNQQRHLQNQPVLPTASNGAESSRSRTVPDHAQPMPAPALPVTEMFSSVIAVGRDNIGPLQQPDMRQSSGSENRSGFPSPLTAVTKDLDLGLDDTPPLQQAQFGTLRAPKPSTINIPGKKPRQTTVPLPVQDPGTSLSPGLSAAAAAEPSRYQSASRAVIQDDARNTEYLTESESSSVDTIVNLNNPRSGIFSGTGLDPDIARSIVPSSTQSPGLTAQKEETQPDSPVTVVSSGSPSENKVDDVRAGASRPQGPVRTVSGQAAETASNSSGDSNASALRGVVPAARQSSVPRPGTAAGFLARSTSHRNSLGLLNTNRLSSESASSAPAGQWPLRDTPTPDGRRKRPLLQKRLPVIVGDQILQRSPSTSSGRPGSGLSARSATTSSPLARVPNQPVQDTRLDSLGTLDENEPPVQPTKSPDAEAGR